MAQATLVILWVGLSAYVLLAGADFGGGFWDVLAGSAKRGRSQRELIEHAMGPVWEANHVWLIFVLVVLWTGFPEVFAAVASTLYIPLSAAAMGVILRGSGFAFRKSVSELSWQRVFGAVFATSSAVTPFFLGAVAGAVASGRVHPGIDHGGVISSWVNPTSMIAGGLAVVSCAYLAAVYLALEARRSGDDSLVSAFRRRGLTIGLIVGAVALGAIPVLHSDSTHLYKGLVGRGLPLVIASGMFGLLSLAQLWNWRLVLVRVSAALAVVCVIWGWAAAQYPYMLLPNLAVKQAAAPHATQTALVVGLGIGSLLLLPSLLYLFVVSQRAHELGSDTP